MLKKPIQEQEIINLLRVYYGLDIQAVHFTSGGADINAFSCRVDASTGSYFVKFKYGDYEEVNLQIVRLLHEAGIKEIIFPISTLEGKLFQQLDQFGIIVYPFVDAPDGFIQHLSEKQWMKLGETLRNIHDISLPEFIRNKLRKENYSSRWREVVRSFYDKVNPATSDDQLAKIFKDFFRKNINIIRRLVDVANELSRKIQPDLHECVLCHSDIHAGNILIHNDDIYIIDWDEPILAPRERDLMFIGGGVGNVWNKPEEIKQFYKGYGKVDINKVTLAYYRHERIVEDIAVYGQSLLFPVTGEESRSEMLKHFMSMFEPGGVVDIAFKTDY